MNSFHIFIKNYFMIQLRDNLVIVHTFYTASTLTSQTIIKQYLRHDK